jgi:hypothetical protein
MNTYFAVDAQSLPNADDPEIHRALIFIVCDKQRKPKHDILITGVGGGLNDPDRAPFIVMPDGSGDNGSECKNKEERFFDTNIRTKTMKPREVFTVWWSPEEQPARRIETTWRINKITPLAGPPVP